MFRNAFTAAGAGLAATALGAAAPASAEIVTITLGGDDTFQTQQAVGYGVVYTDFQKDYIARIGANGGGPFSFTYRYDSDAVAVNGRYAIELVSGNAAGMTDWSDFTAYAQFQNAGTNGTALQFMLEKTEVFGTNRYTTWASTSLASPRSTGLIQFGMLPTSFGALSDYKLRAASFQTFGRGGTIALNTSLSSMSVGAPPGGGAVPEPSAWALFILGFGAVGAAMRRGRLQALRAI
ncbi:PEPxxWA-CTERM sorting domain-containing protein [Qipengyuania sp.]|uniref:PEPxxWA-CTERM sorting domain-containing protein n=1 Tax=Qipengyuania sp. TaxID=2004515 RepID=UPI0035C7F7A8